MAQFARIDGNAVVEVREMSPPPAHKAYLWKPVVIEGSGPVEQTIVDADRVRIVRSEPALDTIKVDIKRKVDADAEQIRMRYLTPGFGMALIYREKHEQALAVTTLGQSPANSLTEAEARAAYPTLAASIGIEAPTRWECAQIVIARSEAFANLSFVIERVRLAAKALIGHASDAAAARAAYEAIQWPS